MSKNFRFIFTTALTATAAFAQTPTPPPTAAATTPLAFEVATIKPAPPMNPMAIMQGKLHVGMKVDAARVDIGFMSLGDLIMAAYKIKRHQVVAPDWAFTERYDILAKMPQGANKDQVPEMLQSLLAERFGLKFHREGKEQSIYALVVGKGGHKMKDTPAEEEAPKPAEADKKDDNGEPKEPPKPAPPPGKGGMVFEAGGAQARVTQNADGKGATVNIAGQGSVKMSMGENGAMRMEFSKLKMEAFAEMLSRFCDRPVVDMTELKGSYQVAIEMSTDMMRSMAMKSGMMGMGTMPGGGGDGGKADAAPTAADPSGSIFSSVQQLGLKLDPRKEAVDTIFVDKLEKTPTEN
jgi:uncharacterized protein (TIGR03435 family)